MIITYIKNTKIVHASHDHTMPYTILLKYLPEIVAQRAVTDLFINDTFEYLDIISFNYDRLEYNPKVKEFYRKFSINLILNG